MKYKDDIIAKFYYHIYELAQITQQYNQNLKPWLEIKYYEIHIDLIRLIILQSFQGKKYFFIFIDGIIEKIDIFI